MWKEARVDIPPLVRGLTWAALLGIEVLKKYIYFFVMGGEETICVFYFPRVTFKPSMTA